MAAGPVARLVAQALLMGFNIFSRAFVQAYQQAAANPEAAKRAAQGAQRALRKEMSRDEALKVLNFDKSPLTRLELEERYNKYFNANDPKNGGSFYLQSKFHRAKEVVEKQLAEEEAAAGGKAEAKTTGTDADKP